MRQNPKFPRRGFREWFEQIGSTILTTILIVFVLLVFLAWPLLR